MSTPVMFRQQLAQINDQQRPDFQRQQNLKAFTGDEYGKLDQAEQTLQAMPEGTGPGMIAPDEKRGKLNAIRAMKLKIITPGIAKGRLAKIQDQFGITQPGAVGNVPAQAPMTLSAPQTAPLQGESLGLPTSAIAEGNGAVSAPSLDAIQVPAEPMSNVGPLPAPQQQLPGKPAEQVQLKPYGMNELLAGTGTMPNPYSLMVKQLTDAGIPLDQAQKAVRVKAGIEAPPKMFNVHPNAEVITGSLNGQPFQYQYDKWALQAYDMSGNPLGAEQLQGFVPTPKGNQAPKVGTFGDFMIAAYGPNPTPQQYEEGRRSWAQSGAGTTVGSHVAFVPQLDGSIKAITIQTSSSKDFGAPGTVPNARQPQQPTAPVTPPPQGQPQPPTPQAAAPSAPIPPTSTPRQLKHRLAGVVGGGQIVGARVNPSQKDVYKAVDTVRPMVNIDQTLSGYVKGGQYSPRQDLALIVAAVRAMNPGTVRLPQQELILELKAGSYGDNFRRWFEKASTGLLPDDQRQDLMQVVHNETAHSAASAAQEWTTQGVPGPLPSFLQPYTQQQPNSGGGGGGGEVSIKVGAKSYKFPNQAAADAFKREAGIQ